MIDLLILAVLLIGLMWFMFSLEVKPKEHENYMPPVDNDGGFL